MRLPVEPVGRVFRLKVSPGDLRAQLVPSFASVLEDWVNGTARTPFSDPSYVLDVTYMTRPLELFLRNVVSGLDGSVVIGGPLERGFGFGKTHALILLWHMFTSDIYKHVGIGEGIENVVRGTLVIGIDSVTDKPLSKVIEELQAYINPRHPVRRLKDGLLIKAVSEVIGGYRLGGLSSSDLATLVAKVMERYRDLGGEPRLLLLVDELGWGISQRLRKYAEKVEAGERADDVYFEVVSLVNFLSLLYAELSKVRPLSGVVIWVIAEQDRKELEALVTRYQDRPTIYNKMRSILDDLDNVGERYSRGLAGRGLCEIHYSYEHAIEIARHRVLQAIGGVDRERRAKEEFVSWLKAMSEQLNLGEEFRHHEGELEKYYPFSTGLLAFLKKLMNPRDIPATEFVRTVISVAAEASQKALSGDPEGSYTIGVRHLDVGDIVQAKLMREVGSEWVEIAGDIKLSLDKAGAGNREPLELVAKYILAKGITADLSAILESRDRGNLERYGSTIHEIQLETLETFVGDRALKTLEKLGEAIDLLITESARIDVVDLNGKRFYLPSILKTVYNKLISYVGEEKKEVENEQLIPTYVLNTGLVQSLLGNVSISIDGRQGDVAVGFVRYDEVRSPDVLLSSEVVQKAQQAGKLLLLLIPPWDAGLFSEMYVKGRSYEEVTEEIADALQNAVMRGRVRRPLHIVVLLPNLSKTRLKLMLDKLTVYMGTKKFLSYLSEKENIIRERLQELEKREGILIKRDLQSIMSEETRRKHLRLIESRLEREIAEARSLAQKQLVRLAREIVLEILELYHKVVYYSLDKNRFTQKEVIPSDAVKIPESREEASARLDLSQYASMVNAFLKHVVKELAYEYDVMRVQRALLDAYRGEFEGGVTGRHYRIRDVLENLMLGAYGVKPLSIDVAREALRYLNGQTIELDEFSVTIVVEEHTDSIRFDVKPRRTEIEVKGEETTAEAEEVSEVPALPSTAEPTLQRILLELPGGFGVEEFSRRILAFMNMLRELDAGLSALKLELETVKFSSSLTLKNPSADALSEPKIKAMINFMSRVSKDENVTVLVEMNVSKPVAEDNVRKAFGDYYKRRLARFERLLQT